MPPENSPAEPSTLDPRHLPSTPRRSPSPNTLLPGLRELASPVLDLASTLTIEAEDGIDQDNVNFLRRPAEAEISGEALTRELRHNERRIERMRQAAQGRPSSSQLDLLRRSDEETRERRLHQRRMAQLRAQMEPRWAGQDRSQQQQQQQQPPTQSHTPYSGQVPHQQSLYDWAPAHEDGENDELEDILAELRAEQPNTHPDVLQSIGRQRLEREARTHATAENAPAPPSHEPSLRSSAILQSIRRNHRMTARSRNTLERYMLDRERSSLETGSSEPDAHASDPQQRDSLSAVLARLQRDSFLEGQRTAPLQHSYQSPGDSSQQLASSASSISSRLNQRSSSSMMHAARHHNGESRPSDRCTRFERAIKTLHWLQSSRNTVQDVVIMLGKAESENLSPKYLRKELYNGIRTGVGPYYTSWLAPGSMFVGSQSASGPHQSSDPSSSRQVNTERVGLASFQNSIDRILARPWLDENPVSSTAAGGSQDRWTVKVAVHAVDWEKMTLQGTMEAFDVPSVNGSSNGRRNALPAQNSNNAETTKASFSTFLEGELIDFRQHTLLTDADSFKATKATSATDAQYWRKLEPFANMHDDQISNALSDPQWIEEELNGKYILMRWKERCFVKDTLSSSSARTVSSASVVRMNAQRESSSPVILHNVDGNGYGLSISGFYYVSLRRRDGAVTGLYYDPQSSPYQYLEMGPGDTRFGAGSWEFR